MWGDLLASGALGPPGHAKAFIATAQRATGKKFGRLLNTNHHRDHTNGNCFFLPAEIVSHEYARQDQSEDSSHAIETHEPSRRFLACRKL